MHILSGSERWVAVKPEKLRLVAIHTTLVHVVETCEAVKLSPAGFIAHSHSQRLQDSAVLTMLEVS